MSGDTALVVVIALSCSGAVGLTGLAASWYLRRQSLRWGFTGVAVVAVGAVAAGVLGTARAMFISSHDFHVVLLVVLVAGSVSLALSVTLGSVVAQWSRSLNEQARRLGEEDVPTGPGGGPAEFAQLSHELARTSSRLAESRRRESQLEASRRELVSWVSHDLRSPLAGLRAMAEALEDGVAEEPARYHTRMRTVVDQMVSMVDDLFELSRIQAGGLPLLDQTVELGDLVSEAIADGDPVARSRGVRVEGAADPGVLVRGDPSGLARVLANLVGNAVRHTPRGATVRIEGRDRGDRVELTVDDACGGIDPADLDRVFEVGWRGTPARTPGTPTGAGLGLAIVRGIVEAHHGSVEVANRGAGCRFLVRLPHPGPPRGDQP